MVLVREICAPWMAGAGITLICSRSETQPSPKKVETLSKLLYLSFREHKQDLPNGQCSQLGKAILIALELVSAPWQHFGVKRGSAIHIGDLSQYR